MWYCPGRFHAPALLAQLLGNEAAGVWRLLTSDSNLHRRAYVEDSAVLVSHFAGPAGARTVTDFMPKTPVSPCGICRLVDAGSAPIVLDLIPAPDYGRGATTMRADGQVIEVADQLLFGSHLIAVTDVHAMMAVPPGHIGFAALLAAPLSPPTKSDIEAWLAATLAAWRTESNHIKYRGPYEREVADSLRALRLATIGQLERDAAEGGLYRRHLEDFNAREEGVFLAGSLWVAQYWIMRDELARARSIIDAALAYRNDLGLFAEEGAADTGESLGNFPQTFVHAALIGAVIDLKAALALH